MPSSPDPGLDPRAGRDSLGLLVRTPDDRGGSFLLSGAQLAGLISPSAPAAARPVPWPEAAAPPAAGVRLRR